MYNFKEFEFLPEDVQTQILGQNRSFDLNHNYADSLRMKQFKEESCNDPFTNKEIKRNVENGFMFFKDNKLWYISEHRRNGHYRSLWLSIRFDNNEYVVYIFRERRFVSNYNELKVPFFTGDYIVPHSEILLPFTVTDQIYSKRGDLCLYHKEELKGQYFLEVYNSLETEEQKDMWLILSLYDKYIQDKIYPSDTPGFIHGINSEIGSLIKGEAYERISPNEVESSRDKMLELLLN